MIKIYHNARCSKSREALQILYDAGEKPEIVEYMKNKLTEAELKDLVKQIGIKPEALVRKKEPLYLAEYKDKKLTPAQWIKAMVKHPELMERPIVVKGDVALIGRPPEVVKRIL